jgi:hypothetical protein
MRESVGVVKKKSEKGRENNKKIGGVEDERENSSGDM